MQTSTVVGREGGAWSSVFRAVTCGGSGRKMRRNSTQTFLYVYIYIYYCSLNPKVLAWEDPNRRARLIPPALVHRQIIRIDHSTVFHQSGSHWERWGPIQNHFTLRAKLIYSRRNCSREIAVFFFPHTRHLCSISLLKMTSGGKN